MINEMDTDGDGTIDLEEFQTMIIRTLRGFADGDNTEQEDLKEYEARYMQQLSRQRDRLKAHLLSDFGDDLFEDAAPTMEQMAVKRHEQSFPHARERRIDTGFLADLGPPPQPASASSVAASRPPPGAGAEGVRSPMAANLMAEAQRRLAGLESRYAHEVHSDALLGAARSGSGSGSERSLPGGPLSGNGSSAHGTPRTYGAPRSSHRRGEEALQASGLGADEEKRLYALMAEAQRRRSVPQRGAEGVGGEVGSNVSSQDGLRLARLEAELRHR